MTYYEELGLSPDASAEEIRQAYRNLARLLHPDQQADETLRRLSENQMKRLNSIYRTLTDPVQRRQYDAGLFRNSIPVPSAGQAGFHRRLLVGRDVALILAGFAAASLYWQLLAPRGGIPAGSHTQENVVPLPSVDREKGRIRRNKAVSKSANHDTTGLVRPGPEFWSARRTTLDTQTQPVETPIREPAPLTDPPVPSPPSLPSSATPAAREDGFAGTWVYVRPKIQEPERGRYPAEYVEAVIVDQGGFLRGRYRARFRVPDRSISAEVRFHFEGWSMAGKAALNWVGVGGARGDLSLKRTGRNTLQLEWVATALGNQMGLGSGEAVLTRKLEAEAEALQLRTHEQD